MISKLLSVFSKPETCACPVCEATIKAYNPLPQFYFDEAKQNGYIYSFDEAETMNYKAYECPNCKCSDRDRLYALYLKNYFKVDSSKGKPTFVDFAPSGPLSKYIKRTLPGINYRTADLMADNVDDKIDITDMKPYQDNFADFFICSHVLEHVSDARKAMRELYRILKPGGKGIAMVPIITTLTETQEDPNITTAAERWRNYGQDDHLRMFSKKGFVSDLKSAGFKVEELGIQNFGADAFKRAGISEKSVLYIVSK